MKKKAILVVSFGTSHQDTRKKTIERIEADIREHFLDYAMYRAYTSKKIVSILKKRDSIVIPTVSEAMEQMKTDGIQEVVIQPTHIIDGIENKEMKRAALNYKDEFASIQIAEPLLSNEEDYTSVAKGLMDEVGELEPERAVIFMGHGTSHENNVCYEKLGNVFRSKGYSQVYIGTVEAAPTLTDVIRQIKDKKYQMITLVPFMVVAGDHAKNDMASLEEDSWKSILEHEGFFVSCIVRGIGEYEVIRKQYIKHLEEAIRCVALI